MIGRASGHIRKDNPALDKKQYSQKDLGTAHLYKVPGVFQDTETGKYYKASPGAMSGEQIPPRQPFGTERPGSRQVIPTNKPQTTNSALPQKTQSSGVQKIGPVGKAGIAAIVTSIIPDAPGAPTGGFLKSVASWSATFGNGALLTAGGAQLVAAPAAASVVGLPVAAAAEVVAGLALATAAGAYAVSAGATVLDKAWNWAAYALGGTQTTEPQANASTAVTSAQPQQPKPESEPKPDSSPTNPYQPYAGSDVVKKAAEGIKPEQKITKEQLNEFAAGISKKAEAEAKAEGMGNTQNLNYNHDDPKNHLTHRAVNLNGSQSKADGANVAILAERTTPPKKSPYAQMRL